MNVHVKIDQLRVIKRTESEKSEIEVMRASFHAEYDVLDIFLQYGAADENACYDVFFLEDIRGLGQIIFKIGETSIGRVKFGVLHVEPTGDL